MANKKKLLVEILILNGTDSQLTDAVFDTIMVKYGNRIDATRYTSEERVVVLVDHASGVIGNGGFEYLFSADFLGDPDFSLTANAFKIVGLDRGHQAFAEAFSLFPGGNVPPDPDVRSELYEAADESRRLEINKTFWQDGVTGDNITISKLAQYIRDHAAAFRHLDAI